MDNEDVIMNKGFIIGNQISLFGHQDVIGFGSSNFCVKKIERNIANKIIIENHYSKKYYNLSYLHLGVFVNDKLLGVLQYGYAMNPASQSSVVANTKIDEYMELNRMWLSDVATKNSETMALSYSIKLIKKIYPKIKWIQSFADERCGGYGIVYQAANFLFYGEHQSKFWELDDVVYHNIQMTVSEGSNRYC